MKLDKKQLPQLVVLGVLTAVVIGYGAMQMMGPKSGQKKSRPTKAARQEAQTSAAAGFGSGSEMGFQVVQGNTVSGYGAGFARRDPFMPQGVAGLVRVAATANRSSSRVVRPQQPRLSFPSGRVPPLSLGIQPSTGQPGGTRPVVVEPPPVQDPDFVLTGVVRGEQNMAIIRSGEGTRHIVKQGQSIDGGYRVASIKDDEVVLVQNKRAIHVRLGGVKNAK